MTQQPMPRLTADQLAALAAVLPTEQDDTDDALHDGTPGHHTPWWATETQRPWWPTSDSDTPPVARP